jgi:hypothetical protein
MIKWRQYFLTVCICCLPFVKSFSQDSVLQQEPSVEVYDTVYATEENTEYGTRFQIVDSTDYVVERKLPGDELERVRRDEAYWYVNMVVKKKKPKESEGLKGGGFDTFMWVLFGLVLIGLVVWMLMSSNVSLFRRSSAVIAPEEEELENIFETEFDKEIRMAIELKNYRAAVRLMYLQTLRLMADRNIIQYTQEKTNSDYLFQLSGTRYYKDFFRLTRHFDYIWYGEFPVTEPAFQKVRNDFSTFKEQVQ